MEKFSFIRIKKRRVELASSGSVFSDSSGECFWGIHGIQICLISSIFFLFPFLANAQDFKADLLSINQKFASAKKMAADVLIELYKTPTDAGPDLKIRTQIFRNGPQFYQEQTNLNVKTEQVFISDGNLFLSVDKELKEVTLMEAKGLPEKALMPDDFDSVFDSLALHHGEVQFEGEKEGLKHYITQNPDAAITQTELFIDVRTTMIRKAVLHYDPLLYPDIARVEITYKVLNLSPNLSKTQFSMDEYLVKVKGAYQLNPSYKTYGFTNLLDLK